MRTVHPKYTHMNENNMNRKVNVDQKVILFEQLKYTAPGEFKNFLVSIGSGIARLIAVCSGRTAALPNSADKQLIQVHTSMSDMI